MVKNQRLTNTKGGSSNTKQIEYLAHIVCGKNAKQFDFYSLGGICLSYPQIEKAISLFVRFWRPLAGTKTVPFKVMIKLKYYTV